MINSNESMDFNDPKELDDPQLFDDPKLFDDPQLFDDQLEVWTLIIEKSTVIPPSLMVLFEGVSYIYSRRSCHVYVNFRKFKQNDGFFLIPPQKCQNCHICSV